MYLINNDRYPNLYEHLKAAHPVTRMNDLMVRFTIGKLKWNSRSHVHSILKVSVQRRVFPFFYTFSHCIKLIRRCLISGFSEQ